MGRRRISRGNRGGRRAWNVDAVARRSKIGRRFIGNTGIRAAVTARLLRSPEARRFFFRKILQIVERRSMLVDGRRHLRDRGVIRKINRRNERRVGKECRSRWSPYH